MNMSLPCKSRNLDRDVAKIAVSQLDEAAIRKMATESPDIYYTWYIDAYTAQRKARLELEFQTALLRKLQQCDPAKAETIVVSVTDQFKSLPHAGH